MSAPRSEAPAAAPRTRWLIPVVLVALGLRLWGLSFGLPLDLRPDERFYQQVVAGMVARGDLDPGLYAYPALPFTLLLGSLHLVHAVAGGERTLAEAVADVEFVTRVQRGLSALLGTVTVLLGFGIGRRLGGRWSALAAAALLATCPLHVMHSHFGVVDVPAAAFVAAAALALLAAVQSGGRGRFVVAGLLAGLATAMRYLPAVLAVPLAVAVIGSRRREGIPRWWLPLDRRLALAAVAMIAGFLAGAPYTVLDFAGFREGFLDPFVHGTIGLGQRSAAETFATYAGVALRHGLTPPGLVLVGLGAAWAALRPTPGRLAVLLTIVLYGALLLSARKMFFRYLIPLVPLMLALAAVPTGALLARVAGRSRRLAAGLLLALLAWPFLACVGSDRLLTRPTSFAELRSWLEDPAHREAPVTFTSETVAGILALGPRVVPLDPRALATGERGTLLVATWHPHPAMADPSGPLALVGDREPLARRDVGALRDAVFEARDRWFHPYAGAFGLEVDGPTWAVWRLAPSGVPPAPAPGPLPRPERLELVPFAGEVAVSWEAPSETAPVAWIVRYLGAAEAARRQAEGRTDLEALASLVVPGGERSAVISDPPAGSLVVLVSALGPAAEGVPTLARLDRPD